MKQLHRRDLFAWSEFNAERNIDFHSVAWIRESGNIVIDPLPMSEHDANHLADLGGVDTIILTNSDHVRDTPALAERTGARILGPAGEKPEFPIDCHGWLGDGDKPVPGLVVLELAGSKTPGELALIIDRSTLITGDMIRCHDGGRLRLLPDTKLRSKAEAERSLQRLLNFREIEAVIPLDGWPIFSHGHEALRNI